MRPRGMIVSMLALAALLAGCETQSDKVETTQAGVTVEAPLPEPEDDPRPLEPAADPGAISEPAPPPPP